MRGVQNFTISKVSIKHKILSCVLAFFVLISSTNLLNFEEYKKNIMKSVEVSTDLTDLVVSQFFNIVILPVSAISKIFSGKHESTVKEEGIPIHVEQQATEVTETVATENATENETTNETENNKGTDTKGDNAIKASIGYSITSDILGINKVIKGEWLKDLLIADRLIGVNFVRYVEGINFVLRERVINVVFVMMLLLAIILARRNVGDNNIINNNINNIKNKKIARFI